MEDKYFRYCGHSIFYRKSGTGDKFLFLFHGFGQTHSNYARLETAFSQQYTIYNFDLFFHGNSVWNENYPLLTNTLLVDLFRRFSDEQDIASFSLCGFSLGAKFALTIIESLPEQVDEIILIAPDGIRTNPWYSFATYPSPVRMLFKRSIEKPGIYFKSVKLLGSLRLLDNGIIKFANTQMVNLKQRERVFKTWTVFRSLRLNLNSISSNANQRMIPIRIFLGKHDRIITLRNIQGFLARLEFKEVIVLNAGHSNLLEEVGAYYETKISKQQV